MGTIVAKFGGTSLADAERILHVADIVRQESARQYVVVSAPGCRYPGDTKVTDLLIQSQSSRQRERALEQIWFRFQELGQALGIPSRLASEIQDEIEDLAPNTHSYDRVLSLGEKFSAKLLAEVLGWPFIDAAELIKFDEHGRYDEGRTQTSFIVPERAVIPGFYGSRPDGSIQVFPRNGSDISGAIVARMTNAEVYENWTDTNGLLAADPRLVPNPVHVPTLTREELQELAYRGTTVLHGDSLFPLSGTATPVHIRNTRSPSDPGTRVVADKAFLMPERVRSVVGIASRTGFTVIELKKLGMNADLGFLSRLCSIFEKYGVSIELAPGSINSQSIIVEDCKLDNHDDSIREEIETVCEPDRLSFERSKLALLCIVGETMAHQHGVLARATGALSKAGVNIRIVDQGASEISIILGVDHQDHKKALVALCQEFKCCE